MSTCRGTWTDERVPPAPGLVLMLAHSRNDGVMHDPTERCRIDGPHSMTECGEFDPPRPGYEPDPEVQGPAYRLRQFWNWERYFTEATRG